VGLSQLKLFPIFKTSSGQPAIARWMQAATLRDLPRSLGQDMQLLSIERARLVRRIQGWLCSGAHAQHDRRTSRYFRENDATGLRKSAT
jgi:hypothetical protein